jgi:hypothetical protein
MYCVFSPFKKEPKSTGVSLLGKMPIVLLPKLRGFIWMGTSPPNYRSMLCPYWVTGQNIKEEEKL